MIRPPAGLASTLARLAPRLAVGFALAAGPGAAGAAVIDVGLNAVHGPNCDAESLTDALALAAATSAADEIRLVDNLGDYIPTTIALSGWNAGAKGALTISSGWSDCSDTVPSDDPNDQALLYTQDGSPVFDVAGATVSLVTLRRVVVGIGTLALRVAGGGTVTLDDALLSFSDRGALVEAGGYLFVDAGSRVYINGGPTADGGGIRCVGAGSQVVLHGRVHENQGDAGGGLYVADGCELTLGATATVDRNEANLGGGILVADGGIVGSVAGARVRVNTAASSGGGIFAEGSSARVTLWGVDVTDNRAGFTGAGLVVSSGAQVQLDANSTCGGVACASRIYRNQLEPGARNGAAATVQNGGVLRLHQTYVSENSVPEAEPNGSVLYAAGAGAELRTESVVVADNLGANRVFRAEAGGFVHAAYVTAHRNWYGVPEGFYVDALAMSLSGSGTVGRINSSVFHSTAGYEAVSGATFSQVDCLLTSTLAGLPASPTVGEVFVGDPLYRDPDGDLRVPSHSPAVDFCDDALYAPTQADLDGRARGRDLLGNVNGAPGPNGRFDVGAYELHDLFSDGFASGNTSRWSDTVP